VPSEELVIPRKGSRNLRRVATSKVWRFSTVPYIIKTDPRSGNAGNAGNAGDALTFCEKPFYCERRIKRDDDCFIWFSETKGGTGLTWRSRVRSVISRDGRKLDVNVLLTSFANRPSIGKDALEPFRDAIGSTPMHELARKLYRHAHNKICEIDQDEFQFLLTYFG